MIEQNLGAALRLLREEKRLSLRTLAERTDFSPSFLSQVENGQASPSILSMEKIAQALGVTLWEFFQLAEQPQDSSVVRVSERPRLALDWSKAFVEALRVSNNSSALEPMLVSLYPGGVSGREPRPHGSEEFAYVLEGQVNLTLGGREHILEAGDAVTIAPGVARRWVNHSDSNIRILVISLHRRKL